MYPTKKHSFMATRWPLDKTLKTQQTTAQHTGVMMPGRSPCGTRRHTAITEDGISPTCISSAPPWRRPLFSHHSSDPRLPLELCVALGVPVLGVGCLRRRLDLREELVEVIVIMHVREDSGIMRLCFMNDIMWQRFTVGQVATLLPVFLRRP